MPGVAPPGNRAHRDDPRAVRRVVLGADPHDADAAARSLATRRAADRAPRRMTCRGLPLRVIGARWRRGGWPLFLRWAAQAVLELLQQVVERLAQQAGH